MDLYSLKELYSYFAAVGESQSGSSLYAAVGVDDADHKMLIEALAVAHTSSFGGSPLIFEGSLEQLSRELAARELFSQKKLFVVRMHEETQELSLEQLQKWHALRDQFSEHSGGISRGSQWIFLFFFRSSPDKELILFFRDHGVLFRPKALSSSECIDWLFLLAEQWKLKVSRPVLAYLIEQIGNHPLLLQSELEKMAIYVAHDNVLTMEICRKLICPLQLPAPWKLAEALIEKRTIAAIMAWRELALLGVELILLNRQLKGFLYNEFQIALLYHQKGRDGLLAAMPQLVGSWNERRIARAQQAGVQHLYQLVIEIERQFLLLKNSSPCSEQLLMEQFILQQTV